jgi:rhamnosyltransferase
MTLQFSVIIPIRNAMPHVRRQLDGLAHQTLKASEIIVLDSMSSDGSAALYEAAGARVVAVDPKEFDHGNTRNLGASLATSDILVFLTQDAVPHPGAFAEICRPFLEDAQVAVVCGRQEPRRMAGHIERHARLFNYPPSSSRRRWPDAKRLGIKAVFNSNSFSAYRKSAFKDGLFPSRTIMGEDQIAVGNALLAGWTVAYAAEGAVEHSHGYWLLAEFRRYFDIGVFHAQNRNLMAHFSVTTGEGLRFVKSELRYLWRNRPQRIPEALVRTSLKLAGYQLGKHEARIPGFLKVWLAMNTGYFASK